MAHNNHRIYHKDCVKCEEIKTFVFNSCREYSLFEGYEITNAKDWKEMTQYYDKWATYEGETEYDLPNEEGLKREEGGKYE